MKTTKYLLAATLAVTGFTFAPVLHAEDTNSANSQTNTATDQTAAAQQNSQTSTDTANSNANSSNTSAAQNNATYGTHTANTDAAANTSSADINNNNASAQSNNSAVASSSDNNMADVKDTHSINSVREQIREIANAALTKNDLEAIRNRLTVADQKRLGSIRSEDSDELNAVIKDIDQKWKDKYNHHFDVDAKVALADPFVRIDSINKAQVASSSDSNKTSNEEVANVTVANDEQNKLPEVNLTFMREHMSWKLQLPAAVDGATLKNNLLAQLQAINADSANWPADENQAYRCVTHRILLGLTGQAGNNAQPAASTGNGM